MVVREKSINLFLMDGKVEGRIKCALANWTGTAYKILELIRSEEHTSELQSHA